MSQKTVLIVEDQIELRAISSLFLESHGYRVLTAETGVEGVHLARERRPDLIVMDLSIPELDGFGAMELLKQDPQTERIPIVVLTAHAYGAVGRRARAAGCDGFLRKPCDPQRLLDEVRERIGETN